MATCKALTLKLEQDKLSCFTDPYVLKVSLSEGISTPLCARILLLSTSGADPDSLQELIGLKALVTIVQSRGPLPDAAQDLTLGGRAEQLSQRYAAGHIISVSFVQQIPGEHPVFVYELMLASAITDLARTYHNRSLHHEELAALFKTLLTGNNGLTHAYSFDLSAVAPDYDQNHIVITQDNCNNYETLLRVLQLYGLNYFIIPDAVTMQERLLISSVLPVCQINLKDDNNYLPLLDDGIQPVSSDSCYNSALPDCALQDLKYTFTQGSILVSPDTPAPIFTAESLGFKLNQNEHKQSLEDLNRRYLLFTNWQQRLSREQITARARDLVFQPGFRFTETGTGSEQQLMVVRSCLIAIAPFPQHLAVPATGFAAKTLSLQLELFNQKHTIKNTNSAFYLGCFGSTHAPIPDPAALKQQEHLILSAQTATSSASAAVTPAAAGSDVTAHPAHLGCPAAGPTSVGERAAVQLLDATITTANGTSKDTITTVKDGTENTSEIDYRGKVYLTRGDDQVSHPGSCYAVIDQSGNPETVVVECLNLWGDGLALPRVGHRVKVLKISGQYLYFGHTGPAQMLPLTDDNPNPHYDTRWRNNKLYSRVLHQVTPYDPDASAQKQAQSQTGSSTDTAHTGDDKKTRTQPANCYGLGTGLQRNKAAEIGFEHFANRNDWLFYYYRQQLLEHLTHAQAVSNNDADIARQYQDKLKGELDAAALSYEETMAQNNATGDKLNAKAREFYTKLNEIGKLLFADKDTDSSLIGDTADPRTDAVIITPKGDVTLGAAQGAVSLMASKIRANAERHEVSCNNFLLSADQKITLAVGSNSITLDRNGVSIHASRWQSNNGAFDSSISLDGISGVSLTGVNASVNSYFGTTISDGFGSLLSLTNGNVSMTGRSCSISNGDTLSALVATGNNLLQSIVSAIGSAQSNAPKSAQYYSNGVKGLNLAKSTFNTSLKCYKLVKGWSKADVFQKIIDCFTLLQLIITSLLDMFLYFAALGEAAWLDKLTGKNSSFTVRDALRLTSLVQKMFFVTAIITTQEVSFLVCRHSPSSITFNPKGSTHSAQEIRMTSESRITCNLPIKEVSKDKFQGLGKPDKQDSSQAANTSPAAQAAPDAADEQDDSVTSSASPAPQAPDDTDSDNEESLPTTTTNSRTAN